MEKDKEKNWLTRLFDKIYHFTYLPSFLKFKVTEGQNYNDYVKSRNLIEETVKYMDKATAYEKRNHITPIEESCNLFAGEMDLNEAKKIQRICNSFN